MVSRPPEITLSTGLLEKLAGLKKPEPPKPVQARPPLQAIQAPGRPSISSDAARFIAQDRVLSKHLQTAKEVSGLLLKAEDAEMQVITRKAEELLHKYSVPAKARPCQTEAQACTDCFKEHGQEAWRCTDVAEAYRLCSLRAFNSSRAGAGPVPAPRG